ncbi:type IX secretion system outer membrane channel protein PorV [Aurantibacillus circumpalustris]|uniref:type IX secretion system outer membrane channel protein PorV n=1 Tax=Aurantibacillus circumpalustris TaxID=3036359 RepID=UPI00295BEAFA|nr:type IX secretion system outer membrane channel protein PorV [Aurantibacillus circumpalustris]
MKKHLLIALSLIVTETSFAQSKINSDQLGGGTNAITTAVPFLLISPDSKQGAMGDVGAATDPDVNSIHWNGSKLAFMDKKFGVGCTVTPWLRLLVPDINVYYLAGYAKINDKQTVGASLRYFSLGNIELTDATGTSTGNYKPNEFAIDLAFSQKLSKNFSLGVATRYIYSGISKAYFNGNSGNAASTFAVDLSMFYKSDKFKLGGKNCIGTVGLAITNVGAKIKYSNDQNFIPSNLRLGGGLKVEIDDYNTFGLYVDFNKLLVPTPPIYKYRTDSLGNPTTEIEINPATGKKEIAEGKDPNVSVPTGIVQSFGDAPGGFKEEMQEINTSVGMEYSYNKIFAVRAGYFHESKNKGSRQFFTVGIGANFNVIGVDFSYLIPTTINNPLQRTWRVTLSFNFNGAGTASDTPKVEP